MNCRPSFRLVTPCQVSNESEIPTKAQLLDRPLKLSLKVSLISLASSHCCKAHTTTSSGAAIAQNINLVLANIFLNGLHPRLRGGTFG